MPKISDVFEHFIFGSFLLFLGVHVYVILRFFTSFEYFWDFLKF